MITVFYTTIKTKPSRQEYELQLSTLPVVMQEDNRRYVQWDDRLRHLCGKLLLRVALTSIGLEQDCLTQLRYNEYNRPYISGSIDFNISHSGDYICCAIGAGVQLGIDVEEIRQVDFAEFSQVMTEAQWQSIRQSAKPLQSFFSYWAIKESVIKAEKGGLSLSLLEIGVYPDSAIYADRQWHLSEIDFGEEYAAFVASDKKQAIELQPKSFW